MSEENVEIVRRGFMAVLDDDWPTALTTLHPEVEVRDFDIPDAGLYRGHEGFREWLSNWGESWEEWRLDNIEFHSGSNGQVIALFKMITKGEGSGIEIERDDAIVYRLDAGEIIRMEYFNRQDAALEAAGLSELAMSQENVDKLRRGYEAFNRGEYDAALAFCHPEIEFFPPGDQPPYRGAERFRAWMEPDAFETQVVEPREYTVAGNKVLVEQDIKVRGAGSGIELEIHSWNVWSFDEEGLATRVQTFLEHEGTEAREAAGLSE